MADFRWFNPKDFFNSIDLNGRLRRKLWTKLRGVQCLNVNFRGVTIYADPGNFRTCFDGRRRRPHGLDFLGGAINIVTGQVLLGIGQLALLKIDGAFVTGYAFVA